jgi:hypothetical protein
MTHRPLRFRGLGAAAMLVLGVGCIGDIGDPGEDGPGGPENGPLICTDGGVHVARHPLRRLTATQYQNTIRDLFGDADFEAELDEGEEIISEREVRQLRDGAEVIIGRSSAWTKTVFPCDIEGAADQQCLSDFLEGFAARAYRRPLGDDERAELVAVYEETLTIGTFREAMESVLQVVLQSPALVYMFEAGAPDAEPIHLLTDHEIASRLSYFLWNTTPDDELLAAAAAGDLQDKEGLSTQTKRLLADPRADFAVQHFMSGWMQLDGGVLHHPLEEAEKDPALYPEFDAELVSAMRTETQAFIRRTFEEEGSFEDLLTARYAYVNGPLATLYGVSGPTDASTWEWVDLDKAQRAGLLTRAAFLTTFSTKNVTAPIRRGVWVLREMLCAGLGDPPPNVNNIPPEGGNVDGEELTVRQDVAGKTSSNDCAACHGLINPIGFTFENYDAIGRWQMEEVTSGLPIDASGHLPQSEDITGAVALSSELAVMDEARNCFAERFYQAAISETLDDADKCSLGAIQERFADGGSMRDLVVEIITSDAFRYVNVEEGQ